MAGWLVGRRAVAGTFLYLNSTMESAFCRCMSAAAVVCNLIGTIMRERAAPEVAGDEMRGAVRWACVRGEAAHKIIP
jgi:hypothetical protein